MADEVTVRPYWASEVEPRQLVTRCLERVAQSRTLMKRSGQWDNMRAALDAYYGRGTDGARSASQIREAGEDGETVEMHINQVRPIVTNAMSLIFGQPPKVKAIAVNTDSKSLSDARLAEQLHQYYDRKDAAEERLVDTIRGGLIASSWTIAQWWNPRDGNEWAFDPETNQPLYEGDYETRVVPPWRVTYDFAAQHAALRKWCLIRYPVARYDTAEQFRDDPEKYAKLCTAPVEELSSLMRKAASVGDERSLDVLMGEQQPAEDVMWVWELRHVPTPALPAGRLVRFVEPDIILFDSQEIEVGYPYAKDDLHCYEFAPERVVAGSAGHTATFDLLGMQEFMDLVTASVATTVNINGQMRWWSGGGEGAQVKALGLNGALIETAQKPEVLNFPALKAEVLAAGDWVIAQMRQAMALNNVVMGQPDKGMPASAQALQRAQAQQFHAVSQGEAVRLVSRVANGRLKLLKRFARTKRVAEIAGAARQNEVKEWTSTDLDGFERFDVEPVNPLSQSNEMRLGMGETLVQRNLMTPDAWLAFVETGSLEQGTDTKRLQKELVESNVAKLQKGIGPPPVDMMKTQEALKLDPSALPIFAEVPQGTPVLRLLKSDPHHIAVPAYLGVLASPSSREDAQVVKACLEAVQFSVELWASLTPDESMAYGIPSLPSSMAMAMPPGAPPPGADAGGPPPSGPPSGPASPEAGLPKPPENPLTGDQDDSGATGLVR